MRSGSPPTPFEKPFKRRNDGRRFIGEKGGKSAKRPQSRAIGFFPESAVAKCAGLGQGWRPNACCDEKNPVAMNPSEECGEDLPATGAPD
jgi:hypothetical protein